MGWTHVSFYILYPFSWAKRRNKLCVLRAGAVCVKKTRKTTNRHCVINHHHTLSMSGYDVTSTQDMDMRGNAAGATGHTPRL